MKLSIKSFKVPDLFIEIPATATVGSLKVCVIAFSDMFIRKLCVHIVSLGLVLSFEGMAVVKTKNTLWFFEFHMKDQVKSNVLHPSD